MSKQGGQIPFNRVVVDPRDAALVRECLQGSHLSGDGPYTKACHEWLESTLQVPRALLTTSCTHALEMSAILLEVGLGDEVIVPAFTFVSTINAFVLRGARPVFCDVRADTLNLDERRLETLVTERTRAIVVVHYAGVACEMDEILRIADAYAIPVIEDNAHGLFGRYRGRWLGTLGRLATQSFHETKNFTSGEGGALLINRSELVERAEIVREKGTDRSKFFRGQVDKYTWVDLGSSYLPSDLLAALLLAQLRRWQEIQGARERLFGRYLSALSSWSRSNDVSLPQVPAHCESAHHMFHMLMPSLGERQRLIRHLAERGISAVFHYLPLNRSPMGARFAPQSDDCSVSIDVADRLVRLPFFNTMTDEEQSRVIDAVYEFAV